MSELNRLLVIPDTPRGNRSATDCTSRRQQVKLRQLAIKSSCSLCLQYISTINPWILHLGPANKADNACTAPSMLKEGPLPYPAHSLIQRLLTTFSGTHSTGFCSAASLYTMLPSNLFRMSPIHTAYSRSCLHVATTVCHSRRISPIRCTYTADPQTTIPALRQSAAAIAHHLFLSLKNIHITTR